MSHSRLEKTLRFTERMIQMVEEIKEMRGYMTFSSVIYSAVADLHSKTFPAYKHVPYKNQEEREREKMAKVRTREKIIAGEKEHICEMLEGKIIDKGGSKVCEFFNYSSKKRYPQKIALAQLSEDLVKTQYQPSREKVEQLRRAGLVDY